ncbi:MAG: MarR family transcriptional regulator, partial [Dokdonella sp.]
FDRRATQFKLTRAQWRTLKTIRRKEGVSQTELADFLDMQPIPVGRLIDRLEKTGYIERRADPGDRRRWRLYLTPKAHAVVDEMEVIAGGLRDDALRDVKRTDFETLLRVLAQIKDNLVALDGAPNEERGKS